MDVDTIISQIIINHQENKVLPRYHLSRQFEYTSRSDEKNETF